MFLLSYQMFVILINKPKQWCVLRSKMSNEDVKNMSYIWFTLTRSHFRPTWRVRRNRVITNVYSFLIVFWVGEFVDQEENWHIFVIFRISKYRIAFSFRHFNAILARVFCDRINLSLVNRVIEINPLTLLKAHFESIWPKIV